MVDSSGVAALDVRAATGQQTGRDGGDAATHARTATQQQRRDFPGYTASRGQYRLAGVQCVCVGVHVSVCVHARELRERDSTAGC